MKEDAMNKLNAESVAEFVGMIKSKVRLNFEKDGYLLPVAFLIARCNPEDGKPLPEGRLAPIIIPMEGLDDNDSKEWAARAIRKLAERTNACLAVVCLEAWQKTPMGKTIGEIAMCVVEEEGSALSTAHVAYIQRNGDSATLSEWDDGRPAGGSGSKFGLLLPANQNLSEKAQ